MLRWACELLDAVYHSIWETVAKAKPFSAERKGCGKHVGFQYDVDGLDYAHRMQGSLFCLNV